jgi:3-oxoacyl-[acyl-carrier-protein] synthase-3
MLSILGMGCAHPSNAIDNKLLEALDVGTNEQWILEKIGIRTRVSTLPSAYVRETRNQDPRQAQSVASAGPTQLGVLAARRALEACKAGAGTVRPEDIGLVVVNCCTPIQTAPAESHRIAAELGLRCPAHDLYSACPAFALHMDFLNNFEEQALPEYVLCISTATMTQKVNYNDRSDGAIWGDGAAAWIVSARHSGRLNVVDTFFATDSSRAAAVVVDSHGFFHQDGRAVRDFSVRQTVRLIKRLEQSHALDWSRDVFIGHQANGTMLEQICNNRKIPPHNHWHNVETHGNQAGAGAPAVLCMHWDRLASGQKIAVAVVGAGLSWGSVLLEVV